jgi:hypothetical protein
MALTAAGSDAVPFGRAVAPQVIIEYVSGPFCEKYAIPVTS